MALEMAKLEKGMSFYLFMGLHQLCSGIISQLNLVSHECLLRMASLFNYDYQSNWPNCCPLTRPAQTEHYLKHTVGLGT